MIGIFALSFEGCAATATGTATATVLESVSVSVSVPPAPAPAGAGTIPALSGNLFALEIFIGSLSRSGPLLRFGSNPPPVFRLVAVSSAVDGAAVNVTSNADGSMSVSGGSGLAFAVSQPSVGVSNIEYN